MTAPASTHRGRSRWAVWAAGVLAAVVAFLVFLPALENDFVDWDDAAVLVDNVHYRGLGPEQLQWMFTTNHYGHYQPITWMTYGVDYVLWGMNPRGYHLTNNIFHAANALLVFFLSLSLLRAATTKAAGWRGLAAALLAALLFAVHPLRVESVAWATERRDLVSAFFLLLAVLAYVRSTASPRARMRWLAASIAIYVVSMLSKVGGAPLPAVLLVLDWYPLRRIGPGLRSWLSPDGLHAVRRVLVEKIPFLVVAAGFSLATVLQQYERWFIPLERHDALARTAQAFYGLKFYAWKTMWPTSLSPLYELQLPLDPWQGHILVAAGVVVAVAVLAFVLRRRLPALAAAALIYAAMLSPLLGYFQNGPQLVADRYSYLSCLGWTLLPAAGLLLLLRRPGRLGRIGATAAAVAGVTAVAALATLTVRQTAVWRDSTTLFTAMYERDPDSTYTTNGLGFVLLEAGRNDEAIPLFRRAIEINPQNRQAYLNLWIALGRSGRTRERYEAYLVGIEAPDTVVRAEAFLGLGDLAAQASKWQVAVDSYGWSLGHREASPRVHAKLGRALVRLGRTEESLPHFRRAAELEPANTGVRLELAAALERVSKYDEAIEQLQAVLERAPGNTAALDGLRRLKRRRSP